MRFSILIILCFLVGFGFSQSGYLGKRNYVELRTSMLPTLSYKNLVKNDESIERRNIVFLKYNLTVSRVISKNVEISASYEFAKMNGLSTGSEFIIKDTVQLGGNNYDILTLPYNILVDPKLTYNAASFSINFFRLGSLAPIGKFVGFSFTYGVTKLKEGEELIIGKRDIAYKDNFFKSVSTIGLLDTVNISTERKIKSYHLKVRIGRNYPIRDNIILSAGMSFPLISYYTSGFVSELGPFLDNAPNQSASSSWIRYSMFTTRSYNRLAIELGCKFLF